MPKKKAQEPKEQPIEGSEQLRLILESGLNHPFWIELSKLLQADLDSLTKRILDDESLSAQITISHRDLYRRWRTMALGLLNLPTRVIEDIKATGAPQPLSDSVINNDPYDG